MPSTKRHLNLWFSMYSIILCFLISFLSVVLSRVSVLKKFDPIIIAYFGGAICSFLIGPSDPQILKAMIGASIAIGFPLLIMGADIHSLLKIRWSEFFSMTLYAIIISVISIGTILFIGKNEDFSTEILLISSSFIGSSPNLFLSAFC